MAMQRQGRDKADAFETTSSSTHYGKGSIRRGGKHEESKYADGWERIFGVKNKEKVDLGVPLNAHEST